MEKLNITIAIDDNHPETGWGVEGDVQMEYLEELNKEFGAKFTLFIPSNYHRKFPISENKDWVEWLLSKGYFELAAHGHYHETSDKNKWGECEFFELDSPDEVKNRINEMFFQWEAVNHIPSGWRNPGWLASVESCKQLQSKFKWSAVHYEHNRGLDWGQCKAIFGADGINETEIKLHNGHIMFQSHIAGEWNKNIWNENNYLQLRESLRFLTGNFKINYCTISEL